MARAPIVLSRRGAFAVALALMLGTLLLGSALGWYHFRRSLPVVAGVAPVSQAKAPIEVVRDKHGIPHIFAQTPEDAYFGLGYVHAQDRLWQMELNRRLGSGTLAEILGEEALPEDRLFRTLGLRRLAARNVAALDAETRRVLEAYSHGVNAFLTDAPALPPEFALLRIEPSQWTPTDSLVWLKAMGFGLSANWANELFRLRLSRTLSARQVAEFLAPYPGDRSVSLPALPAIYGALDPAARVLGSLAPVMKGETIGSNNWVVSGARSATGKPLLANDPHLDLTAPSLWYLAHLHAPGWDVIGATQPGLPAVILGRNAHVAWAFTNTESDTQDLFVEKLVPGGYLTPDGPRAFSQIEETIAVKGGTAEQLSIRGTRHGPVISDVDAEAKHAMPSGYVLALNSMVLRADDRTLRFPLRAARARNAAEVLEATRDFHTPQQNIVYADSNGAIGFIAAGRVPLRAPDNDLKGLLPAPGWLAKYDWLGSIPWHELPQSRDPTVGRLVTANQKITPLDYAHWLSAEWAHPYRADRIERLLDATSRHDLQTFTRIQMDVKSGGAELLLPLLVSRLPDDEREHAVVERLRAWNREMRAEAAEPLVFAAWLRMLTRLVYEDELGQLFDDAYGERVAFMYNVLSDAGGQSRWCDDVNTPARESCAGLIQRALALALADLERRYGGDLDSWRWGTAHQARSQHLPFGSIPLLSSWFDVTIPSHGDNQTVNLAGYSIDDDDTPFTAHSGPGYRAIYDLAHPDSSLFVLSTGQSGHPLSPHYRDMSNAWATGGYVPMTTNRSEIERGALGVLRLEPR